MKISLRDLIIATILLTLFWVLYTIGYMEGEADTIEWYEEEETHICDEGCTA